MIERIKGCTGDIVNVYKNIPLPRFVWVCELFSLEDYPFKCIGEIVIDGTSSTNSMDESIILLHYPFILWEAYPDDSERNREELIIMEQWDKFDSYRGNLHKTL